MTTPPQTKPDILVTDTALAPDLAPTPPARKPRLWVLVSAGAAGLLGLALASTLALDHFGGPDLAAGEQACIDAIEREADQREVNAKAASGDYQSSVETLGIEYGEPFADGDAVKLRARLSYRASVGQLSRDGSVAVICTASGPDLTTTSIANAAPRS